MVNFNLQSVDKGSKWQQCCMIHWTNLVYCILATLMRELRLVSMDIIVFHDNVVSMTIKFILNNVYLVVK
jgi:hypothetical protein